MLNQCVFSNNQYLTKVMNPQSDLNKLVKGYESKIILISNELEQVRSEKEDLTEQHENVKKLLIDSNSELQQKSKQLRQKQKICSKLKQEKDEVESIMHKSQRHRKVLYDHLFSELPVTRVPNQNQLLMQLTTISDEFNQANFMQLQKIIMERNSEVKKISAKYNELLKDHLKSTYDYQEKIRKLKQNVRILQRSSAQQIDIEKKLQQKMPRKCEELLLVNKSLEQRVAVMVEKIKMDEDVIRKLNRQLRQRTRQKSENLTSCSSPISRDTYCQPQDYANMIKQNSFLKKQLEELQVKYYTLTDQFPELLQSEDQITRLVQKYNKIYEFEQKFQVQAAKIAGLESELKKTKQDCFKYVEEIKTSRKNFEHNERTYKSILVKLREFFILVNPHYETYNFEQLDLTPEQEQSLKKVNSQQASLKAQLTTCKDKINQLNNTIQSKSVELQRLRASLEEQNKKVAELKSMNQFLQKGIKEKSTNPANENQNKYLGNILKIFNKLQEERNSLALQLRNETLRNVNLAFEISRLKDQDLAHAQSLTERPKKYYPEINIARPSVVYLQFNKDFSDINTKLLDLQTKIQQNQQSHSFVIKQLKAEHESLIDSLKQKILKLEMQKKELIEKNISIKLSQPEQEQHSENVNLSIQIPSQSLHDQSMLDIDDHVLDGQGVDEPLNTLAAESVQEMAKLLRGHQFNTKNLIQAYNNLKARLQDLETSRNQPTDQTQVQSMKAMITQYANQITILKTRLRQSDHNLVVLENALAAKNDEIQNIRLGSTKQIQQLKKLVQSLQEEAETLRKEDWLQQSPLQKNTSKKHFPEQIEYLVGLVMQLKGMLRSELQRKVEEVKQVDLGMSEENTDKDHKHDEQTQLKQLVDSGRLVSALEEAIRRLQHTNSDS